MVQSSVLVGWLGRQSAELWTCLPKATLFWVDVHWMSCFIHPLCWRHWKAPKQLSSVTEAANFSSQMYLTASGKGKAKCHMRVIRVVWGPRGTVTARPQPICISWREKRPEQTTRGTREWALQLESHAVHGINLMLTGYRYGLSRTFPISAAGTREEMGTTKWGSRRMSERVYSHSLHQATGSQS